MRNNIIEEDLKYIVSRDLPWENFGSKTILISGAYGVLPAYMVETMLYLNEVRKTQQTRVIAVVRNEEKAIHRFAEYLNRDDFRVIAQDICKPLVLEEKIDYIIHAASQASPKYFGNDPVGTLSPNVIGTYNLLELARNKKVEGFLFFSSGEVYGEITTYGIPVNEEYYGRLNHMDIRSCYGESKRMGENMCICWQYQYDVPARIVRISHTYGPGMQLDDGRVFADFTADIVNNRDIVLKSNGDAVRPFCYIADAASGFFTVLLKGENGEAYNVANDKCVISISELADILVSLFSEKQLKVVKKENSFVNGYLKSSSKGSIPDTSKIRALGWKPEYSVEEGFRRTIASFM